jgi:hypothetical protein
LLYSTLPLELNEFVLVALQQVTCLCPCDLIYKASKKLKGNKCFSSPTTILAARIRYSGPLPNPRQHCLYSIQQCSSSTPLLVFDTATFSDNVGCIRYTNALLRQPTPLVACIRYSNDFQTPTHHLVFLNPSSSTIF